ncbi:MAG: sn-glycerol-3-phosphate ABC transporter ATP-binding protein UgpC [Alphaproteobacteria bacterium]
MAAISLQRVSKVFAGGVTAVDAVDLEIADGEFMVLLGPSGCGKSTTLRMIAGLETISSGDMLIDGERVNETDPRDRDLAIVFQNYALYPHMNVARNLGFGLRLRGTPPAEIARRVQATAAMLGIEDLLRRKPGALSGGQRQRVALGRALIREPRGFLLDEPLSNLDAQLRTAMRLELVKLHRQLGTTIVHVTHDQLEAMTMGQRICIMHQGRVVQVGPPREVYRNPANVFVAGFLASPPMNLLPARLVAAPGDGLAVEAGTARLPLPAEFAAAYAPYRDRAVVLGIRPEDLDEAAPGSPAVLQVTASAAEMVGPEVILVGAPLGYPDREVSARLGRAFHADPGQAVRLAVDMRQVHLFDPDTTAAIPRPDLGFET